MVDFIGDRDQIAAMVYDWTYIGSEDRIKDRVATFTEMMRFKDEVESWSKEEQRMYWDESMK